MDARVNDFLNEINEIAPLNDKTTESIWEKCFDEDSGYYYFWNTKTNEVTWDMPSEYRASNKPKAKKGNNLYIPPRTAPLFPSTSNLPSVSEAIKIYKIGEVMSGNSDQKGDKDDTREVTQVKEEKIISNTGKQKAPDKKVVLISSYGDSDSEEETKGNQIVNDSNDVHIPTQDSIEPEPSIKITKLEENEKKPPQLSLVAGYSDTEEELSDSETPKPQVSHSTLFPITKPIDVKHFESTKTPEKQELDSKLFQRKKRIGVALINTGKKSKMDDNDHERKGLGFSNNSNNCEKLNNAKAYSGFKSGGVMFVKADVLNPTTNENKDQSEKTLKEIEDTYATLKEKLDFLTEGHEQISPIQIMLIQIETLHTALRSGDLKQNYLKKWLDDTCSDLIKLEKETAPEGWNLQWDRTHKRYYYQNAASGESQWEYPQEDVTVCDEAMDICTTPPPNGTDAPIHMSPPLPPAIRSPSPPPPPSISECGLNSKKKDMHLPLDHTEVTVDVAVEKYDNTEPLPPGVDTFEENHKKEVLNDMNDVLNSFYHDIAAIETSSGPPTPNVNEEVKTAETTTPEVTKKKKKKVKLAQGLAMKKKGVSKLVEKWKNVQMSYKSD